jgi:tetratricopeptide (TPR) repeat protein
MDAGADGTTLIYVAYALRDKKLWEALHSHMSTLRYNYSVQIVDARSPLQEQAHYYLERAHVILLLLSPDFIQASVCRKEMEYALKRHQEQSVRIIPIRIRPLANWGNLPISMLETRPPHNQSLTPRQRDKVFADVVDEICQIIDMLQTRTFAPFVSGAHLINMFPPIDAETMIQRTSVIEKVYEALVRPDASAVLMTGLSGIGKTALAAQVYHHVERLRLSENCMFVNQSIWLPISATTTLATIAETLCRSLNRALLETRNLAPSLLAQELLRLLDTQEQPRLIILDQFEQLLDMRTGQARNLQDGVTALFQLLAYRSCQCRFLLVSRFAPWGMRAYSPAHLREFEVPPLETSEGVALLRLWDVQGRRDELERAIVYCQGHAQALVSLYAFLKLDSNVSLSSLSHEIVRRQHWVGDAARDFLEYSYVHQLSSEQRLLLRSFSIYRRPVPENAVFEMVRLEDQALSMRISPGRRSVLDVLLALKLLVSRQGQYYTAPHVVAEFICTYFQKEYENVFREAHRCAANYYIRLAGDKKQRLAGRRQEIDDIAELIEAIWHLCQAGSYEAAYKLLRQEQIYTALRNWGESAVLYEIYQQFFDWSEGLSATIYNELGEIAMMQGQAHEARKYFTDALSLSTATMSDEEQVTLLSNLGGVDCKLGQLEEAQRQYQKALSICEEKKMANEAQGVILNNIGGLLCERGDRRQEEEQGDDIAEYAHAITYYKQALSLYQQANIPEEAVRTLNNLGDAYSVGHRKEEAREYYGQALQLAGQIGARWSQAVSLGNLGVLCREEADLEQAWIYYGQALRIFRQIGSCWEEAILLRDLGNLSILYQRYDAALACFIQARDIFVALQCPERGTIPDWVEAELSLARDDGDYKEWFQSVELRAISLLEQVLYDTAMKASMLSKSADDINAHT